MTSTTIDIERLRELKEAGVHQGRTIKDIVNEMVDSYINDKVKCTHDSPCKTCLKEDWIMNMYSLNDTGWICRECWNKA